VVSACEIGKIFRSSEIAIIAAIAEQLVVF